MSTPPPAGPTPSPEISPAPLPPAAPEPTDDDDKMMADGTAGPSSPPLAGPSPEDTTTPAIVETKNAEEEDDEEEEADLFGDDDDEDDKMDAELTAGSRDGSQSPAKRPDASMASSDEDDDNASLTSSQREKRSRLEYAEDGSDAEGGRSSFRELHTAQEQATTWEPLVGSEGKRWILRLPKHVHHHHIPYAPSLYTQAEDPVLPELLDDDVKLSALEIERRKAEELMRQVGSTIRWRWVKGPDGTMIKQPNARILKWSDGSLSLQLGKPSNQFSLITHPDDHFPLAPKTHLVHHHWEAELMQTEGAFDGHLTLVPVGMEGEAHRVLAKGVKERNREKSRMKMWDEDKMTASNVEVPGVKKPREKARRGPREKGDGAATSARKKAVQSATRDRAAGGGGRRGNIYSDESDSEDDDEDERRRRRRSSAGGKRGGRGDDEDGGGYADDGFVVSDEDEDAPRKQGKKRRGSPTLSSSDEDEASALESEESDEASSSDDRRKKASKSSGGGKGKDRRAAREASIESEDMDSEDDEDGPASGEIKKKRVVIADEEDEE